MTSPDHPVNQGITELTVYDERGRPRIAFPPVLGVAYRRASMGDAAALQTILASHEREALQHAACKIQLAAVMRHAAQLQTSLNQLHGRRFSERAYAALVSRAAIAEGRLAILTARLNRGWVGRALRALKIV